MSNLLHIDEEYKQWILTLSKRFRRSQVKAAVHINQDMLRFYWQLGQEIVELHSEQRWGSRFFANLSRDLKDANPDAKCFSETNLLYMKNFYLLYSPLFKFTPQAEEQIAITPQHGEQIFSVPWGHHKLLIDKCKDRPEKAMFYVQQTLYELQKLYPTQIKGTIPTIEEIENELNETHKPLIPSPLHDVKNITATAKKR